MKIESSYKYLGDLAQSNGKNDLNIKERVNRGLAQKNKISIDLEELCLGPYYFVSAVILRDSLFLSTLVTNGETWFNLTKTDIDNLEQCDEALLRMILAAHSKTAREMLYLALGVVPVRFILMSKRLNYLKYMLNEDDGTMLKDCLLAQQDEPTRGDWYSTIKADLEQLDINMNFQQIRNVSVNCFKTIVRKQIRLKALAYLQQCQLSHSKSRQVTYKKLEMEEYLKPGNNLTIQEKQFIFKARTNMLNVKSNFKIGQPDLNCRKGCAVPEDQQHILHCKAISDDCVSSLNTPQYGDLFGDEVSKISIVARILMTRSKCFLQDIKPSARATQTTGKTGATADN